jgi:hypothetical protein
MSVPHTAATLAKDGVAGDRYRTVHTLSRSGISTPLQEN